MTHFVKCLEAARTIAAGVGGAGALQYLPMLLLVSQCIASRLRDGILGRLTTGSRLAIGGRRPLPLFGHFEASDPRERLAIEDFEQPPFQRTAF